MDAELAAILGQFEALAGKWKEDFPNRALPSIKNQCGRDLSSLIQSVKKERGLL